MIVCFQLGVFFLIYLDIVRTLLQMEIMNFVTSLVKQCVRTSGYGGDVLPPSGERLIMQANIQKIVFLRSDAHALRQGAQTQVLEGLLIFIVAQRN